MFTHFIGGSAAWHIAGARYTGRSFDATADVSLLAQAFLSSDKTKLILLDDSPAAYEYDLTNGDITTASLNQSKALTGSGCEGGYLRSDGLRLYYCNSSSVYHYNFGSAHNVSTLSHQHTLNVSAKETITNGVEFDPNDGGTMYITGQASDAVHQYALSTGWLLSSASFSKSFSVSSESVAPQEVRIRQDNGMKMFVNKPVPDEIFQYSINNWDIGGASYDGVSLVLLDPPTSFDRAYGYWFTSDGKTMLVTSPDAETVYEFAL